jgi:hypothetical protein
MDPEHKCVELNAIYADGFVVQVTGDEVNTLWEQTIYADGFVVRVTCDKVNALWDHIMEYARKREHKGLTLEATWPEWRKPNA